MTNEALSNPYRAALQGQSPGPFAGRKSALSWLHQRLTETSLQAGHLFTGRANIGKTSLLLNLNTHFDETFIGVYVPLGDTILESESDWLLLLAQNATAEIMERGFALTRLTNLEPPADDVRDWFANVFLPEILAIIRPHRRLAFLIDDAGELLRAENEGQLEPNAFLYLRSLLDKHRQLAFILTLGTDRERDIPGFAPLVNRDDVYRLTNLSQEDTVALLQEPVADLYQVPEATAIAVHRATGGAPLLLQMFGSALYWRWEDEPEINVMTGDDARMVTATVAKRADDVFDEIWHGLTHNERLVLSAIAQLGYRDPLRAADVGTIEAWLVETEYPLDRIAVAAAVRSLEYEELVTTTPAGISLGSGLLQTWLLENAALPAPQAAEPVPETPQPDRVRRLQILIVALALVVITVLALIALSNAPREDAPRILQPTVTLLDGS
jgi:hypothetical protein